LLLGDKKPRHLSLDIQGDEDRARLGLRLHPCGEVWRVAEHLPGRLHDNGTGFEPNAGQELGHTGIRVAGVEFGQRTLDGKGGPHGAFGIVLLRLRVAEEGHQPVAEFLQHMTAKSGHRL
jgi:hypothetical protein